MCLVSIPSKLTQVQCTATDDSHLTVLTYILVGATSFQGVDSDVAVYLLSAASSAGILGRLMAGVLVDRIGTYLSF